MASILRIGASAAVALALLPAAGSAGSTGSGLYGTVKKGPIMPACQLGVPCDGPVRGTLVFTKTNPDGTVRSTETWRVRTNQQGRYRIALGPGYYTIRSTVRIGRTKLPRPHAVHVRARHWDKIDLFFDTGIR